MKKKLYIGKRVNPQLKNPYYNAYGELTKADAKKKENCAYGSLSVTGYETKEAYEAEIEKLKAEGFTVNINR